MKVKTQKIKVVLNEITNHKYQVLNKSEIKISNKIQTSNSNNKEKSKWL